METKRPETEGNRKTLQQQREPKTGRQRGTERLGNRGEQIDWATEGKPRDRVTEAKLPTEAKPKDGAT